MLRRNGRGRQNKYRSKGINGMISDKSGGMIECDGAVEVGSCICLI